ncbi:hypothetical protein ABVT39_023042 [Epinephelus coioides]
MKVAQNGREKPKTDESSPKRTNVAQTDESSQGSPKRTKVAQNGPKLPKTDENSPQRTKVAQNGRK